MSATTMLAEAGTTAKQASTDTSEMAGARRNQKRSAWETVMSSLKKSLIPSAIG